MTANSPELMSPSAPTGLARGVSSPAARELVDARHRLDDRRVRGPVGYGESPGRRSPTPTRRSTDGVHGARPRRSPRPMRSSAPDLKFSATTSKCGASASTSSRPGVVLRSMATLRLSRLLRRNVAPDRSARRDRSSPAANRDPTRRSAARSSRRRRRAAPAAASRTAGPASARARARGRRRAACRTAPLPRSPRHRAARSPLRVTLSTVDGEQGTGDSGGAVRRRRRYPAAMRGILSWSAYLPYRRLDRSEIAPFVGQGGGKGTRTVASYDEDSTTMAVEAGAPRAARHRRRPRASCCSARPAFPPTPTRPTPPRIHAALRLPTRPPARSTSARRPRSAVGGLLLGAHRKRRRRARGEPPTSAPACPAAPRRPPEGDAAAAFVVGDDADGPGRGRVRRDRRASPTSSSSGGARPGELRTKVWDERFSEIDVRAARRRRRGTRRSSRPGSPPATSPLAAVAAPAPRVARGRREARRRPGHRRPLVDGRQHRCRAAGRAPRRRCWSRPNPGRSSRWSCWPTAPTCSCSAPPTRSASYRPARRLATQIAAGGAGHLRQVPRLAGHAPGRAAAPARTATRVGHGRGAQRGLEVRLRRLEGARHRRRPPASGARVTRRRRTPTRWIPCRSPTPRARS